MARNVGALLRALISKENGSAAITVALTMPLVVGAAGFGVETSYWYYKDRQLQAAADNSAYAAALEKRSGSSNTIVIGEATTVATQNGYTSAGGTIAVNIPPLAGSHMTGKAVEVILTQTKPRLFTAIFSHDPVILKARGVAAYEDAGSACVVALHKTAGKAALFSGSSDTTFTNCSVMANSFADNAATVQGAAKLSTSCLYAAGGISAGGGLTLTGCPKAKDGVTPVADPFADLIAPSTTGACNGTGGNTLSPGIYCSGLTLSGNKTLNPGIYVIKGGDLKINNNATATGAGVMFYLVDDARISFNGGATVNFSAPTSGPYAGVLFFGDRSSSGGSVNKFNGTAASNLTGAIYFASQDLQWNGNFSGSGGCTQVVGLTVEWTGNATVAADCTSKGMRNIPAAQIVSLVE